MEDTIRILNLSIKIISTEYESTSYSWDVEDFEDVDYVVPNINEFKLVK